MKKVVSMCVIQACKRNHKVHITANLHPCKAPQQFLGLLYLAKTTTFLLAAVEWSRSKSN